MNIRISEKIDKNIFLQLHDQLKEMDVEIYYDILCDLILTGKSVKHTDIASDTTSSISTYLADNYFSTTAKEMLYKQLYAIWKYHNPEKIPVANKYKKKSEIFAWGYEIRNKKTISANISFDGLDNEKLSAFWEVIKFSKAESLSGIDYFDKQSPEAWKISCSGIKNSNLKSFKFGGPSYLSHVTVDMWSIFWDTIKSSTIEHLDLCFVQMTGCESFDLLWSTMCDGISESKLKSLSMERMGLDKLNFAQWANLYHALRQTNMEFLNLTCNHLFALVGQQDQNEELNSFDVLCQIISLPTLKHVKLLEDKFERLSSDSFATFCSALSSGNLENLEICISGDAELKSSEWQAFIDIFKDSRLKHLCIGHHSAREITSTVLKPLCEMIELSQLESISFNHSYSSLSLSSEDWGLIACALKSREIKSLNFGSIKFTEKNLTALRAGLSMGCIEELHLPNISPLQLSTERWHQLSDLIMNSSISTLKTDSGFHMIGYSMPHPAWHDFCNMIVSSGIKSLHFILRDYNKFTLDEINLFCDAIKNSQLETLVLDFNSYLNEMPLSHLKKLFGAINNSGINCLPYQNFEDDIDRKGARDIISNTLKKIEFRSKYKNSLFGLCASTLFNKYHAELTETGIVYEDDKKNRWEEELSEPINEMLKMYI